MNIFKNIIIFLFLCNVKYAISQENVVKNKHGNQAIFNVDLLTGSISVKVNNTTYLYPDVVEVERQV